MSSSITTSAAQGFSRSEPGGFFTIKNEKVDEFLPRVRARAVRGHQVVYPNVDGTGIEGYSQVVGAIDDVVATSWPTFSKDTGIISRFVSQAEINEQVPSLYGRTNNIGRELLKVRVRSILAAISDKVINGDSTTSGEFDGLIKLATDASMTAIAGDFGSTLTVLSPGDIERAVSRIRGGPGSRVVLMGNADLHHELSQSSAYTGQFSWTHDPVTNKSIRMISGVPLLRNDFIPTTASKTKLLAVSIAGDSRVELLYPRASAGSEITIDGPYLSEANAVTTFTVGSNVGLIAIGDPVSAVIDITV